MGFRIKTVWESVGFNEVYASISRKLLVDPDHFSQTRREDGIREIIDAEFTVLDPSQCFASVRKMSMKYLMGELEFYMSGSPFLKDIAKHSKFWEKCSDDGETVNSNYGKLLLYDEGTSGGASQFEYALSMLNRNMDSKKAVMVVYSKENARISNDNPCTMYLHFFIRNNQLDLYVKMRSSDIWFGLPYDVPFFCIIQRMMYDRLCEVYPELRMGSYHHQSGSLHLYERNVKDLSTLLNDQNEDSPQFQNVYTAAKDFLRRGKDGLE